MLAIAASVIFSGCVMKQDLGQGISVRDYAAGEKPSAEVIKSIVSKDAKKTKAKRKADQTDRHVVDKTRNALDDMGYAVGDKLHDLFGSTGGSEWEAKLIDFHYMKLVSRATQKKGDVSIRLHELEGTPIKHKDKSAKRHFVTYVSKTGSQFTSRIALKDHGVVLTRFDIKNGTNNVLRPDAGTLMVVSFEGRDGGTVDIERFFGDLTSPVNYIVGNVVNRSRYIAQNNEVFKGKTFTPKATTKVWIGLPTGNHYERVSIEGGGYENQEVFDDFASKMKHSPLKISLYGMPVKVNAAGNITKRANFTWRFEHKIDVWEGLVKKHNLVTALFDKEAPKLVKYKATVSY
ncbi:MAG: hypothetical protein COB41_06315 [Proteobacteria bacterium]|nr:MAG: hypothetical protein COB41_06315 [Pseudomonadota bacterium]